MTGIAWRCENAQGDIKYAAIQAHVDKLEADGYTCVLDPDAQFNEHDTSIYSYEAFPPHPAPPVIETVLLVPEESDPQMSFSEDLLEYWNLDTAEYNINTRANVARTTGKYYFEFTLVDVGEDPPYTGWFDVGVMDATTPAQTQDWVSAAAPGVTVEAGPEYGSIATSEYQGMWENLEGYPDPQIGQTMAIAIDLDECKLDFRIIGEPWANGADPAAGTNTLREYQHWEIPMVPAMTVYLSRLRVNFGATAFLGDVPEGFVAWQS